MKANQYPRKKRFLAFLLSTLMLGSTALGFASCKDESSSSSSSSSSDDTTTEEYVDTDLLKNAGFENFDDNGGLQPIAVSPTSWKIDRESIKSSGNASASTSASGVIDTATKKWDTLTTSYVKDAYKTYGETDVADKWDEMSTRDKLEYYRDWKADHDGKDTELRKTSFYEQFTIDDEDLPIYKNDQNEWVGIANPRTHDYTDSSETDSKYKSKVLMLHNTVDKTNHNGSAYKATSQSSITVKAGTSAQLSLWVKTDRLEANIPEHTDSTAVVDLGAYIQITHTVGGTTLDDPIEVKNINTAGVTDNNGWVQYEFYLKGSYYVDSTFNVVLGLGHGNDKDYMEYVNGYAFFDDIQCDIIENSEYETLSEQAVELDMNSKKHEKVFSADLLPLKKVAMNFYGLDTDFSPSDLLDLTGWKIAPTVELKATDHHTKYTAVESDDISKFPTIADAQTYSGLGFNSDNDRHEIVTSVQALSSGNDYDKAVYNATFKDKTFLTNEKALVLLSAEGLNYTANSPKVEIPAGERRLISFFVKTSAMDGATGATVTLTDANGNKTSISAIDTTTITATSVGEKEIYDGWQQCLFFIYNETELPQNVSFTFNYGSTSIIGTSASSYREGFAVFSGFKTKALSKQEYAFASNSSYSKAVTLTNDDPTEGKGDSGFDTATNSELYNIENGFAVPQNYTGVYSDSMLINNKNSSTATNSNKENSGLLNKNHAENYADIFTKLGATGNTPEEKWSSVFSYATQPLLIYNDGAKTDKSYGFIGTTATISANSYKAVSLNVKTSPGAIAGIYLVDMSDDTRTSYLSIGRNRTYWYDANGNVCDIDPTSDDFNKNKNVAFKLQTNGLYLVDEDWVNKGAIDATKYYANLANYEVDANGNLLVAEGGVSYNYSDAWHHEGNDGIAFYGYDATTKTAYADKAKTILVHDFSTVTALKPRHEAREATASNYFEIDTNGELATVNFFIHTGSEAKTYRLEVWSGTRDGKTVNSANSYVYFDLGGYAIDATKFAGNIEDYKEESDWVEGDNYFENTFSFYDSAKYLRYNESLDENKVGNQYTEYDPTDTTAYATHKTATAYMRYENATDKKYEIYTDYALTDTNVTVDPQDTEDDDKADEDNTATDGLNPWLLASSIAVAGVLIVAIALIIIRKSVSAYRKKHGIYKD